jgi:hypothetical protein
LDFGPILPFKYKKDIGAGRQLDDEVHLVDTIKKADMAL